MSNFAKRLILTLFSIPLLIFFLFWPLKSHIIIIIIYGIFGPFLGSLEISTLIFRKGINIRRYFLPALNSLIYIFGLFFANNDFHIQNFRQSLLLFFACLITCISFIYARDIIKKDLSRAFEKIAYTIFGLLYIGLPSFLIPFIFNIEINPQNPILIFYNIESHGTLTGSLMALFMLINIFANDIFCYVFGKLFGRNNVINLEASPKKSWAGYIGGYFSIFFFVTIYYILFDRIYGFINFPIWFYYLLPFFSGVLIPIGDLVESVIKRSANVKDSGNIILGRGGVLDSIDTLLYFIPIFFIYIQLYFSFI